MGITYSGLIRVRELVNGNSHLPLTAMGWGGSDIPYVNSQTGLGSELFPVGGTMRNLFFETRQTENPFTNVYSENLTTSQLNGGSILEIGVFDSRSGVTMFSRQTRSLFVKTPVLNVLADNYLEVDRG